MNTLYTEYNSINCYWYVLYGVYDSNGFWGEKLAGRLPAKPTARQLRKLRNSHLDFWRKRFGQKN